MTFPIDTTLVNAEFNGGSEASGVVFSKPRHKNASTGHFRRKNGQNTSF